MKKMRLCTRIFKRNSRNDIIQSKLVNLIKVINGLTEMKKSEQKDIENLIIMDEINNIETKSKSYSEVINYNINDW